MKNIKDAVEKSIKNIRTSLFGTITSVLKSNKTVYAKLSDEEEIRDIKVISPYGFFSLPLNNQNGQILFNNSAKKASLIGVENTPPVELNPGEAIVFCNTDSYILLKEGKVYIKGDVLIEGNITHTGTIQQGVIE